MVLNGCQIYYNMFIMKHSHIYPILDNLKILCFFLGSKDEEF